MDITTPNGYKVVLKRDYLTYGEQIEVQKIYLKDAKVNPNNPKDTQFSPSIVFEAQKYVFLRLVDKIVKPDNTEIRENLYETVMEMRGEDGTAIFEKIDELTNGKKKTSEQ